VSLKPGARLGPYEVTAQVGRGGMGEVYRATDTGLKRAVAIKVLPDALASDVDRLARFQREAEVLASLNHPNIAAIYGLERAGTMTALVMELVEGPTLADRIARGPLSMDEALPIARQVAEALEAAHEQGFVHRDLKPANIKVRPDGAVKVLDFGLAKAFALEPRSPSANAMTHSPTLTNPVNMTGLGVILGTAAYMAPEQARGKAVTRSTDIWAFGCVLYEMLTGRPAFPGDDAAEIQKAFRRFDDTQIAVQSLTTSERKVLVEEGADARYVPTGHLCTRGWAPSWPCRSIRHGSTSRGRPLESLTMSCSDVNALSGAVRDSGTTFFSVSNNGTLAYVPGGMTPDPEVSIIQFDRAGVGAPLPVPRHNLIGPRLSRDGRRLAAVTSQTPTCGLSTSRAAPPRR
jgi:serine/threonine protein kinase